MSESAASPPPRTTHHASDIPALHGLRIALVHDWLNQRGGAENVLEELVGLFPTAPVYTSIYDAAQMPAAYQDWDIRPSPMQRLPGVTTHHQAYLPLYPLAFANTDLSGYNLVISNKSGFCHGVGTQGPGGKALHVCYCLTPTRYLWLFDQYRQREQLSGLTSALLQPVLALLRQWDWAAAHRVDHFIAISTTVQERIRAIYSRESVVIHPPVDTDFYMPDPAQRVGNYFLVVSRLIPYKRIDLAVAAFRELPNEKLVIVGEGRDLAALQGEAGPNVHFVGRQPREQVRELLRGCKAFLFPGLEDFGIAPVEALACGRPVLAYGAGGALDTVTPGVTGEFFMEPTAASLLATLRSFEPAHYDPIACRTQAERFSRERFRGKLLDHLAGIVANG